MFDPALDMSLRTPLTRKALWIAISDPRHLHAWFPEITVDVRPGGAVEAEELPFKKRRTRHASGTIEKVEPGELIRFSWRTKGRDATTRVELHVADAKGKSKQRSKLRVVESGFERDAYAAIEVERMRDFWRDRLVDLKTYAERADTAAQLERAAR